MNLNQSSGTPSDASTGPLVSIGVPVYNGADLVGRALSSLLAQSYANFEIIISDNCSTDQTGGICQSIAARDPRVAYHRNETNIGSAGNFVRTAHLARGKYFMWAAHDDYWAPQFVEQNVRILEADESIVASISRVGLLSGDESYVRPWWVYIPSSTTPLMGSVSENVRRFVFNPGAADRFYGLYRREAVLESLPFATFFAADCAFLVKILGHGKFAEVPEPLFFRSIHGVSSDEVRTLSGDGKSWMGRVFPMWQYSRDILQLPHVRQSRGIYFSLAYINAIYALAMIKARIFRLLGLRPLALPTPPPGSK